MKRRRGLWISLLTTVAVAVIALSAIIAAGWAPKLGLDLDGGLAVVYQTHTSVNSSQLSDIVTILNDRVSAGGTSGATVASQGKNQIAVSIPGEKNSQAVLASLGNTAQLFFRPTLCYAPALTLTKGTLPTLTPLPSACAAASALTAANLAVNTSTGQATTTPAPDGQFATYPTTSADNDAKNATVILPGPSGTGSDRYVLGPAQVTGSEIKSASATLITGSGAWAVNISFNQAGATAWDNLAQQQFHAMIGIDLDGQVISSPLTQPNATTFSSFGGQVQITGSFSQSQAQSLATELQYGSLPVKLDRLTVQTVSPTLGKASLQAGLIAGLAGLLVVMLYMLFFYRLLGLVVISGLAVTGALLWAVIATMGHTTGTTIDLAGVIGIIVSIGITVDSYIIYFERLKDETRSGRTIRTSVDRGFASAYRTVLAADAVSFLAAAILYFISIGPVRGFALFLGLSTILDVVITYYFTRPFVVLLGTSRAATEAKGIGVRSGLAAGTEVLKP
jgi:preprotein translocase subunit SecD